MAVAAVTTKMRNNRGDFTGKTEGPRYRVISHDDKGFCLQASHAGKYVSGTFAHCVDNAIPIDPGDAWIFGVKLSPGGEIHRRTVWAQPTQDQALALLRTGKKHRLGLELKPRGFQIVREART